MFGKCENTCKTHTHTHTQNIINKFEEYNMFKILFCNLSNELPKIINILHCNFIEICKNTNNDNETILAKINSNEHKGDNETIENKWYQNIDIFLFNYTFCISFDYV